MPNLLEPFFPAGPSRDGETPTYTDVYVIGMTARVGSTALVSALESAGLTNGAIREIFSPREEIGKINAEYQAGSFVEFLNKHRAATNPDGALVLKTTYWDMDEALRFAGFPTIFPNPKFAFMDRHDRVAQAYSLWKANVYGVWHRPKGEKYTNPVDQDVPLEKIKALVDHLDEEVRQWRQWFAYKQIDPLTVYYEDFNETPHLVTASVYEYFTGKKLNKPSESFLVPSSDDKDRQIVAELRRRLAEKSAG